MGMGTVIISHIAFSVPFVTLTVRARLHGFDNRVEEAAMDLGANEFTTFRKVTLPLIAPGVLAGAMLAFTLSLDDFIITFFTTGPGARRCRSTSTGCCAASSRRKSTPSPRSGSGGAGGCGDFSVVSKPR
jgi:ABC-type molybdate transport system permease subunit